jgi:RNA polymerase sigma-70 factor (ECF subfamily)
VWDASDEALVAGLAVGDVDVARVFVRRFQARVYGLALSITHDRSVAEEAAQEAFLRAWRYAASFDPRRGSAATWLLTIARNAALDQVRVHGRRQQHLPSQPLDEVGDVPGDQDIEGPRDDHAVVAEALRSLPAEQRDTLVAAAFQGLTAREISEAWGVPLGTVKTRLRLAMNKLRDTLTEAMP